MPIEDMINVNEATGKVTIVTRSNSKIVIDDPNKTLCLQDVNGNRIEMGPEGITITSVKDITFQAAGNLNLNAGANVAATARGDVTVGGANITQSAQMAFTAKGSATVEMSSTGTATLKGAMVMIN